MLSSGSTGVVDIFIILDMLPDISHLNATFIQFIVQVSIVPSGIGNDEETAKRLCSHLVIDAVSDSLTVSLAVEVCIENARNDMRVSIASTMITTVSSTRVKAEWEGCFEICLGWGI